MKKSKIKDDINTRIGFLDCNNIQSIYNEHRVLELNNVLEGFSSDFFTIILHEPDSLEEYTLMYVGDYSEIRGLTLKSGRNLEDRDLYTLQFSKAIEDEFPENNSLVVFNTFQNQLKKVYENFGVLCVPEYLAKLGTDLSFMLGGNRKYAADRILQIDILEIYQSFFSRKTRIQDKEGLQKVYLMYDKKVGQVKIGETKKELKIRRKGVAEPTLRATDQMVEVITAWEASKELESQLHSTYSDKRTRGEWFDLRAYDLEEIDKNTSEYNMIEI